MTARRPLHRLALTLATILLLALTIAPSAALAGGSGALTQQFPLGSQTLCCQQSAAPASPPASATSSRPVSGSARIGQAAAATGRGSGSGSSSMLIVVIAAVVILALCAVAFLRRRRRSRRESQPIGEYEVWRPHRLPPNSEHDR